MTGAAITGAAHTRCREQKHSASREATAGSEAAGRSHPLISTSDTATRTNCVVGTNRRSVHNQYHSRVFACLVWHAPASDGGQSVTGYEVEFYYVYSAEFRDPQTGYSIIKDFGVQYGTEFNANNNLAISARLSAKSQTGYSAMTDT